MLRRQAKEAGLNYSRHFRSSALGAGLLIISRFPIKSSRIQPYCLNGSPLHVIAGDWYVGKAAASVVLDFGRDVGEIEVFTTHLYAGGGALPDWKDAHRTTQAWQLATLADISAQQGRHVIVCGDLNSNPETKVISLLKSHGQLHDAWDLTHAKPRPVTSPQEAIRANGMTCDSPVCSFSAGKNIKGDTLRNFGKRLDYILFRPATPTPALLLDSKRWTMLANECAVCFTDLVDGQPFSYSDHFGVEALFTFSPPAAQEALQTHPALPSIDSLSVQALKTVVDDLKIYGRKADAESHTYLIIFGACLLACLGLPVAASFQPLRYLNWIFVLAGSTAGALGATMLYVGFIGYSWQQSNLQTVIDEMQHEVTKKEWRMASTTSRT